MSKEFSWNGTIISMLSGWIVNGLPPLLGLAGTVAAYFLKSPMLFLFAGFVLGWMLHAILLKRLSSKFGTLVIHSASWGTDQDHEIDVTKEVQGMMKANRLYIPRVNNDTFGKDDPHFHHVKKLTVVYAFTGMDREKKVGENDSKGLILP